VPGTHEVTNQPPPLVDYDVAASDAALLDAVHRHGAGGQLAELSRLGELAGSGQVQEWGREANEHPPRLVTHDRYGHRIDEVAFHPSWHQLMTVAVESGLHARPWRDPRPGAHVARAAAFYVWSQAEGGHGCPISMTFAAVPVLRREPAVAEQWLPRLLSGRYDFGLRPPAQKAGCLAGMGMTEKQGGSDVRANTTRAVPAADGGYLLTGHKWFCSAPMCDAFLVLAQAPGGLTCFLLPRVRPDGTRNVFRLQRLKDKLGNRSNASSEVEFEDTWAQRIGPEGRGVATIIDMVAMTRLDCVTGSAALMRQATAQAIHHAQHRRAFGDYLVDKPVMTAVLADLALEAEAGVSLALRLAAAVDGAEAALLRLLLPAAKFWICKRAPVVAGEALECLGGNGFVEDSGMPRLYREAPLNSIWEGSGNVNALDVLRALRRQPEVLDALAEELAPARGGDARVDHAVSTLLADLAAAAEDPVAAEPSARRLAEAVAVTAQAALLVRFAPPPVADAFLGSRLGEPGRAPALTLGTLPGGADVRAIVARAAAKPG
jgi:putative acyl-CoA dehydrogenase